MSFFGRFLFPERENYCNENFFSFEEVGVIIFPVVLRFLRKGKYFRVESEQVLKMKSVETCVVGKSGNQNSGSGYQCGSTDAKGTWSHVHQTTKKKL